MLNGGRKIKRKIHRAWQINLQIWKEENKDGKNLGITERINSNVANDRFLSFSTQLHIQTEVIEYLGYLLILYWYHLQPMGF